MKQEVKIIPEELINVAIIARGNSYAPYSKFGVGAALLSKSGEVFSGCNIESAAFTPGNCAERTALFKAVSRGVHEFAAIAIVGDVEGETPPFSSYCAPCGVCRQMLYEFSKDGSLLVIMAKSDKDYRTCTLKELLPEAFVGW